jgi:hypothetical protein
VEFISRCTVFQKYYTHINIFIISNNIVTYGPFLRNEWVNKLPQRDLFLGTTNFETRFPLIQTLKIVNTERTRPLLANGYSVTDTTLREEQNGTLGGGDLY